MISRNRNINFEEKEFNMLNNLIINVFNECGFANDEDYDWNKTSTTSSKNFK